MVLYALSKQMLSDTMKCPNGDGLVAQFWSVSP